MKKYKKGNTTIVCTGCKSYADAWKWLTYHKMREMLEVQK